jgi:hypothetical protein
MCGYLGLVTFWIYPWIFFNNSKFNSKLPHYADSDISTTGINTLYNRREDKAKRLICAIPQKSGTRPWRSHYQRLKAAYDNYRILCICKKKMSRLLATCLP